MIHPNIVAKWMLWVLFIMLFAAGIRALIVTPAQLDYGTAATISFRSVMTIVLVSASAKFAYDMRKLNQLNKSR